RLNIYRTKADSGTFYFVSSARDNTKTSFVDGRGDSRLTIRRDGRAAPDVAKFNTNLGSQDSTGSMTPGKYDYRIAFGSSAGLSLASDPVLVTLSALHHQLTLVNIPVGPAGTTYRSIYRKLHSSNGPYQFVGLVSGNAPGSYTDKKSDADLGRVL